MIDTIGPTPRSPAANMTLGFIPGSAAATRTLHLFQAGDASAGPNSRLHQGEAMFSFQRNRDLQEVREHLLRIVNQRATEFLPDDIEQRATSRSRHTIPVEVILWEEDAPVVTETITALTRNISDTGVGVIMHHPLRVEKIVLGFWISESFSEPSNDGTPLFFLADIVHHVPIGGPFWIIGTECCRTLRRSEYGELETLVPRLSELAPRQQEDPELLHTLRDGLSG